MARSKALSTAVLWSWVRGRGATGVGRSSTLTVGVTVTVVTVEVVSVIGAVVTVTGTRSATVGTAMRTGEVHETTVDAVVSVDTGDVVDGPPTPHSPGTPQG